MPMRVHDLTKKVQVFDADGTDESDSLPNVDEQDAESMVNTPRTRSYFLRTGGAGAGDVTSVNVVAGRDYDQRSLTSISQMYDINGKGYLDPTERALRNLDTDNKGYLSTEKLYYIMATLQEEQTKSAVLIETIHMEQRKAMNLKKALFALAGFALLLALANVGTSFAAAKLARDVMVSSENDMININTGARIGTTEKIISFSMVPLSNSSRSLQLHRHLAERVLEDFCYEITNANNKTRIRCQFEGTIDLEQSQELYKSFCPGWTPGSLCTGGGTPFIHISCGGIITKIYGGPYMASKPPTAWISGSTEYTIFPSQDQGYYAEQAFALGRGRGRCIQLFDMALYCPRDGTPCFVFSAFEEDLCGKEVQVCPL